MSGCLPLRPAARAAAAHPPSPRKKKSPRTSGRLGQVCAPESLEDRGGGRADLHLVSVREVPGGEQVIE